MVPKLSFGRALWADRLLASCIYNRDHVSGIFRDRAKSLLADNQLLANLLHLEMLVDRVNVEDKNQGYQP